MNHRRFAVHRLPRRVRLTAVAMLILAVWLPILRKWYWSVSKIS